MHRDEVSVSSAVFISVATTSLATIKRLRQHDEKCVMRLVAITNEGDFIIVIAADVAGSHWSVSQQRNCYGLAGIS